MSDCTDKCEDLPKGIRGPRGYKGDKGDKGDAGSNGSTGPSGAQGPQGPQGDKGDKGDRGLIGPKGDKGPVGPVGPIGPKGADGKDGQLGASGGDGKDGLNGDDGKDGNYTAGFKKDGVTSLSIYDGVTNKELTKFEILDGIDGKSGRGVAVFVQANQPSDSDILNQYKDVPGFTVNQVDVTGIYQAVKLRPGDIWIKP